jgi:hypothetical protein
MMWKLGVAVLVLVGLAVAGISFRPVDYQEFTLRVKGVSPAITPERVLVLRLPQELLAGEPVLFEMNLPAIERAAPDAVFLEGRLELAGAMVVPGEVVLAPDRSAQPVSFRWLVTAAQEPLVSGTLWLTEIFKAADGSEVRVPLLARPLELEWRTLLGLSLPDARWLGGSLAAAGVALALYKRMWRTAVVK